MSTVVTDRVSSYVSPGLVKRINRVARNSNCTLDLVTDLKARMMGFLSGITAKAPKKRKKEFFINFFEFENKANDQPKFTFKFGIIVLSGRQGLIHAVGVCMTDKEGRPMIENYKGFNLVLDDFRKTNSFDFDSFELLLS